MISRLAEKYYVKKEKNRFFAIFLFHFDWLLPTPAYPAQTAENRKYNVLTISGYKQEREVNDALSDFFIFQFFHFFHHFFLLFHFFFLRVPSYVIILNRLESVKVHFWQTTLQTHQLNDQPTDQPTDQPMDKALYRDAWMYQKRNVSSVFRNFIFWEISSSIPHFLMVLNECPVPSRLSRGTGRDGTGSGRDFQNGTGLCLRWGQLTVPVRHIIDKTMMFFVKS